MKNKIQLYLRKLSRERKAREEAESLLEIKSTKLYETNAKLLKLNQNLESEVKRRTKEAETQREKAENASKAKTQFIANISHEIRTPLANLINISEILKKTSLDKSQSDLVNMFDQSSDLLLNIINDVLEITKIESGKFELSKAEFDINKSLNNLLNGICLSAYKKKLYLNPSIPYLDFNIIADESKIKQILLNLIGNSIKFTPTGGVTLQLSVLKRSNTEAQLYFEVKDTGVGIPKEKLKLILDPFEQADTSDTRKYGGTGLGLTICQQFLNKMGSQLQIESTEAEFSKFSFTLNVPIIDKINTKQLDNIKCDVLINEDEIAHSLKSNIKQLGGLCSLKKSLNTLLETPNDHMTIIDLSSFIKNYNELAQREDIIVACPRGLTDKPKIKKEITLPWSKSSLINILKPNEKEEQQCQQTAKTARKDRNSPLILLVEDSPINAQIIKVILEAKNFEVLWAKNGQEAIDKFSIDKFDLIFMDCQMPIKDGFEATKEIRKIEHAAKNKIPIIALTANSTKAAKEKCFEAGMNDFMLKPCRADNLIKIINKFVA